jgi:uncharacterized protein YggE
MKILSYIASLLLTAAISAFAQSGGHTLTVLSTGSAAAIASHVSLQLTVTSQDQTATGLFIKQNDVVERLKKALKNAGVEPRDISEEPFHLLPNYEYGQQGTRITGYRLDTPLGLQIDNVKDLPRLIDLATANGASAVTVGNFSTDANHSLHEEAVQNAISNARKEAVSLAKEMGKNVGDIVSITEMEDAGKSAPSQGGEEEEGRHASAAAQPNTLSEKAGVQVVFELR